MRLISSVKRLEAGAARARSRGDAAAVGLVWTVHEDVVDLATLADGEYVACDIRLDRLAGCPRAECDVETTPAVLEFEPPCYWAVHERITEDPQDLGLVRDGDGRRVGRVMALEGSMITIEWDEAMRPARG